MGSTAKAADVPAMPARVARSAAARVFIVVYLGSLFDRTVRFDDVYLAHLDLEFNTPLRTIELNGSVDVPGIKIGT